MMARDQCSLQVRQQPKRAQVVQENNPKNRKPIDPPPIIELKYDDHDDPQNAQWLVNPRMFMMVTLISVGSAGEREEPMPGKHLIGQTVSSLHRLKDINNKDGGFFVFGDLSAKKVGWYKLRFSLFDTCKDTSEVMFLCAVDSAAFQVVAQRDFGSMSESTHLTRTFSDQGVKLRVRKDNRAISRIGNKRSYDASSSDTMASPGIQSQHGMYGGAVQDPNAYSTAQSPAAKRHQSHSGYGGTHMYAPIPSDNPMAQYSMGMPEMMAPSPYPHHMAQQGGLPPYNSGYSTSTYAQSGFAYPHSTGAEMVPASPYSTWPPEDTKGSYYDPGLPLS